MSESFPTVAAVNRMVEPFMEAAGIEPARHSPRQQFVYFIQAGGKTTPIKIGIAADPASRLRMLQVGNHRDLTIISATRFEQGLARRIELLLHSRLIEHWIAREWFKAHADVLAASFNPRGFVADQLEAQDRNALLFAELTA